MIHNHHYHHVFWKRGIFKWCYPTTTTISMCISIQQRRLVMRVVGDGIHKTKQQQKKMRYTVEQAYQNLIHEPSSSGIQLHSSVEDAIECQILLNLRPEYQKGTHIRGTFALPHGLGTKSCIVVAAYTSDANTTNAALAAGARYAGTDLGQRLVAKTLHVSAFQRLVVSRSIMAAQCTNDDEFDGNPNELTRLLRKNQLLPTEKDYTLVDDKELPEIVQKHVNGHFIPYCIKDGALSTKLGKVSTHDHVQIAENLDSVLRSLYQLRPQIWAGKGPGIQPRHRGKFIVKVHLSRPRKKKTFPLRISKLLIGIDDLGLFDHLLIKRTILTL